MFGGFGGGGGFKLNPYQMAGAQLLMTNGENMDLMGAMRMIQQQKADTLAQQRHEQDLEFRRQQAEAVQKRFDIEQENAKQRLALDQGQFEISKKDAAMKADKHAKDEMTAQQEANIYKKMTELQGVVNPGGTQVPATPENMAISGETATKPVTGQLGDTVSAPGPIGPMVNASGKSDRFVATGEEGNQAALNISGLPVTLRQAIHNNPRGAGGVMKEGVQQLIKDQLAPPAGTKDKWAASNLINMTGPDGRTLTFDGNTTSGQQAINFYAQQGWEMTGKKTAMAKETKYKTWINRDGDYKVIPEGDTESAQRLIEDGYRPENAQVLKESKPRKGIMAEAVEANYTKAAERLSANREKAADYRRMSSLLLHGDHYRGTGAETVNNALLFAKDTLGLFSDQDFERIRIGRMKKKEMVGKMREAIMGSDRNFSDADRRFLYEAIPGEELTAESWGMMLAGLEAENDHEAFKLTTVDNYARESNWDYAKADAMWDAKMRDPNSMEYKTVAQMYSPENLEAEKQAIIGDTKDRPLIEYVQGEYSQRTEQPPAAPVSPYSDKIRKLEQELGQQ